MPLDSELTPSSSALDLVQAAEVSQDPNDWHVVLRSTQGVVVRYNRDQRALAVETHAEIAALSSLPRRQSSDRASPRHDSLACPLCKRPWGADTGTATAFDHAFTAGWSRQALEAAPAHLSTDYFQLLSDAHQTDSLSATPEPSRPSTPAFVEIDASLDDSAFSEGYYTRFFRELAQLGRGMTGAVYLCQHVLNGNPLGLFACKKIPVGNDSRSLVRALKEINHLEALRHPNIVAIHHVWLETAALSLGPPVPCLYALMDYANAGSLDTYIQSRGGLGGPQLANADTSEALKQNIRLRRASKLSSSTQILKSIHLLSFEEIFALFTDIVAGMAFLHERNLLHLDVKAENILLHRPDSGDALTPTAMLSDFGSSEARNALNKRFNIGTTGTLDYLAPEAFGKTQDGRASQHTAALDMWALGLVLHLLVFFRLPYRSEEIDALTSEIKAYSGFNRSTNHHNRRDVPEGVLDLLESLINVEPSKRPSAASVLKQLNSARHVFVPQSTAIPRTSRPRKFASNLSKAIVPKRWSAPSPVLPSPIAPETGTHQAIPPIGAVQVIMPTKPSMELQVLCHFAFRLFVLSTLEPFSRGDLQSRSSTSALAIATLFAIAVGESVGHVSALLCGCTSACVAVLAFFVRIYVIHVA